MKGGWRAGLTAGSYLPGSVGELPAFLRGTFSYKLKEVGGNNRSVMPLDALGGTRVTLRDSTCIPCAIALGNP